jgi:arylsulfatase A-like enzyme
MIANMDYNIGRLLALLDKLGIAEQTLVFFTSDNGPENDAGSPGPFKGRKRLLTEGGIRIPAIAQWSGRN